MSEETKMQGKSGKKITLEPGERISRVDHFIVKTLIGGLLIAIMVMFGGGILFLITLLIPNFGLIDFLSLNIGLQVLLIGGILFASFGLLILFNIIWKAGYSSLIKLFYSNPKEKKKKNR